MKVPSAREMQRTRIPLTLTSHGNDSACCSVSACLIKHTEAFANRTICSLLFIFIAAAYSSTRSAHQYQDLVRGTDVSFQCVNQRRPDYSTSYSQHKQSNNKTLSCQRAILYRQMLRSMGHKS